MEKMRLEVTDLRVESFHTNARAQESAVVNVYVTATCDQSVPIRYCNTAGTFPCG